MKNRLLGLLLLAIPIVAYASGSSYFIPTLQMVVDVSPEPIDITKEVNFTQTPSFPPCAEGEVLVYTAGDWACGDGGGGAAPARRDDFTALADGIETDFTLSEEPALESVNVYLDGLFQRQAVDYTITGTLISFVTPPSAQTTSLYAVYAATFTEAQLATASNEQIISITVGATVNGAAYEVMNTFVFPGSELSGTPARVLTNEYKSSGGGTCDFRIYDLTNAQVIYETTLVSNTDPNTISNETGIANVAAAPAIWEVQGKRNGGGTSCTMDYLTLVWR